MPAGDTPSFGEPTQGTDDVAAATSVCSDGTAATSSASSVGSPKDGGSPTGITQSWRSFGCLSVKRSTAQEALRRGFVSVLLLARPEVAFAVLPQTQTGPWSSWRGKACQGFFFHGGTASASRPTLRPLMTCASLELTSTIPSWREHDCSATQSWRL